MVVPTWARYFTKDTSRVFLGGSGSLKFIVGMSQTMLARLLRVLDFNFHGGDFGMLLGVVLTSWSFDQMLIGLLQNVMFADVR